MDIDGEAASDQSGSSVSLNNDGTILAIGAARNDDNGSNSGHVRVYENIAGVWTQLGADINGEASVDFSGNSVSLKGAAWEFGTPAPNHDNWEDVTFNGALDDGGSFGVAVWGDCSNSWYDDFQVYEID